MKWKKFVDSEMFYEPELYHVKVLRLLKGIECHLKTSE